MTETAETMGRNERAEEVAKQVAAHILTAARTQYSGTLIFELPMNEGGISKPRLRTDTKL